MLVSDPKKENLSIEVRDSLGFTDLTVGTAEVRHLRFADMHACLTYDSIKCLNMGKENTVPLGNWQLETEN